MSNNEGKFSVLSGGVAHMQFGADDADESQDYAGLRGHQTPGQDAKASHSEIITGLHGAGVLGTASDAKLLPTTRVTVNGVGMQLQMAERMGYVHRDANGEYHEGPAGTAAPQQPQQQQAPAGNPPASAQKQTAEAGDEGDINAMKPELLAPEVEAELSAMAKDVPAEMMTAAVVDVVASLLEGDGQINVKKFAAQTGMPEEKAAVYAAGFTQSLSLQADEALKAMQVDPAQFVQWAREHRREEFKQAMSNHATARTLAGYRELGREFLRSVLPGAEALQAAGYETKRSAQGELMVNLNGQWTTVAAAARTGRI
jgi:hypothetical protein